MAHEIDQTTGQAAVFVTGEPAWHKLGTVIEQAASSVEAIGLAGLDWAVEQWPVRAFDPDHPQQEAAATNVVATDRTPRTTQHRCFNEAAPCRARKACCASCGN